MANNPGILARLFGRAQQPAPVVSALFANAIGQPLLVHPQMGEQLIGGYLHGAVDMRPPLLTVADLAQDQTDPVTGVFTPGRAVAVLNVSGALVNRFEPGMCDPGPVSYESLMAAYNTALADDRFEAVVIRLETPGGMASGLFDLADRINATNATNGGTKRVIACIDDYAYSAGYGIAAACDEVWITRTGGAGSVGVIAYHYDQSGYDARIGLKVTPVYSGEHKADMSPHAPLGDSTREWLQQRMDSMRQMFAASVAKYRGMDVAAVLATEAQVYQGEGAIAIGFADRLGTFADLMRELTEGVEDDEDKDEPEARPRQADALQIGDVLTVGVDTQFGEVVASIAPAMSAEDRTKLDRAEVTDAVMASGLAPALAMALLSPSAGVTPDTAAARIAHTKALADLCAAAGLPDVAAEYATKNTDIETARAQLQAVRAEDGPELSTSHPPASAVSTKSPPLSGSAGVSGNSIRSRHRNAAAGPGLKLRQ